MKLWKLMLVLALTLVAVLALASCGSCEHPAYDEAITTRPTCTEEGVKTFTCTECGDTYTEPIPVIAHDYAEKATAATCTEPMIMTRTCKVCNHVETEELAPAKGHSYDEVVTYPTCTTGGFTTYTCSCGDTYTGDETPASGVHNYKSTVVALTAEQAALNPDAIGIEALKCEGCGDTQTTENAVLVHMDFDTMPENVDTYEGSDLYKTMAANEKSATHLEKPDVKAALIYLDSQAHTDIWTANCWGVSMKGDGALTMGSLPSYFVQDFFPGYKSAPILNFTMSFDLIINDSPIGYSKEKQQNRQIFFAIQDEKLYNNVSFALALNNVDLDEAVDEVTVCELYVQSYNEGPLKVDEATGYKITIGKKYSYKIEFTGENDVFMATIFIKAEGEAEYTKVGSYEYVPHTRANRRSCISFGLSSQGAGNILDNYMTTVALAK